MIFFSSRIVEHSIQIGISINNPYVHYVYIVTCMNILFRFFFLFDRKNIIITWIVPSLIIIIIIIFHMLVCSCCSYRGHMSGLAFFFLHLVCSVVPDFMRSITKFVETICILLGQVAFLYIYTWYSNTLPFL